MLLETKKKFGEGTYTFAWPGSVETPVNRYNFSEERQRCINKFSELGNAQAIAKFLIPTIAEFVLHPDVVAICPGRTYAQLDDLYKGLINRYGKKYRELGYHFFVVFGIFANDGMASDVEQELHKYFATHFASLYVHLQAAKGADEAHHADRVQILYVAFKCNARFDPQQFDFGDTPRPVSVAHGKVAATPLPLKALAGRVTTTPSPTPTASSAVKPTLSQEAKDLQSFIRIEYATSTIMRKTTAKAVADLCAAIGITCHSKSSGLVALLDKREAVLKL